jgi:phenylacetate 2-hydroxylase
LNRHQKHVNLTAYSHVTQYLFPDLVQIHLLEGTVKKSPPTSQKNPSPSIESLPTMLEALSPTTLSFVLLTLFIFTIRFLNSTDTPKIKNLPEIPGIPLFGNLLQLGSDHARVAASWVSKHGPVFQVRLGNRRIVFANTFDSVRHLWITNQSALISRPTLYTFHSVVSSSQGFTIGTSPWDESCKQRRKAAATALNRPAVQSYMPIVDLESCVAIRDLYKDSNAGGKEGEQIDLDPRKYFHRFALNTSLTLNYGIRIDGSIDTDLLREGMIATPSRNPHH